MKTFRISILLTLFCISGLVPLQAVNSTKNKQKDKTAKIENVVTKKPAKNTRKSLRKRVKETLKLIFKKPKAQNNSDKSTPLSMARLALIFGILGLLLFGLFSIPAVILGIISLKRIKESRGFYTGRGMAIAGIVLGAIPLAFLIFVLFVVLSFNGF